MAGTPVALLPAGAEDAALCEPVYETFGLEGQHRGRVRI